MSEPASKKQRLDANKPQVFSTSYSRLTCEHIHVDTSIYPELIDSSNSQFVFNNNKWLVINNQHVWEFISNRVKFVKRAEVPEYTSSRIYRVVSDSDNHELIVLGLTGFYVLNTDDWHWCVYENKINAPINVPNYASGHFIFSYNNNKLFHGTLPFKGGLDQVTTRKPQIPINFPWANGAAFYKGDYYFINLDVNSLHLVKLCMLEKEFICIGPVEYISKFSPTFGFARDSQLYFVSGTRMLIINKFELNDITYEIVNLPPSPFLAANDKLDRSERLYHAFDGNTFVVLNKYNMTFLTFNFDVNDWNQPITFQDYPPPLHETLDVNWVPWRNSCILLCKQFNTIFIFDTKTWKWTAKIGLESIIPVGRAHTAVFEDKLYVHITTGNHFNRIELTARTEQWRWSPVQSFDKYHMFNVSSLVVVNDTLYALGAHSYDKHYDWLAMNLHTNTWSSKQSQTKVPSPLQSKRHLATYSAAQNRIYAVLDQQLVKICPENQIIENIKPFPRGADTHLIEWHDGLLLVGVHHNNEAKYNEQHPCKIIQYFNPADQQICDISGQIRGEDCMLYNHEAALKLNDEVYIITRGSPVIIRLYDDVLVKPLQYIATKVLCNYLDMDNVFTLLDYSVNLGNRVLKHGCITFLKNNTMKMMQRVAEINQLSDGIKNILLDTFTYLPIK